MIRNLDIHIENISRMVNALSDKKDCVIKNIDEKTGEETHYPISANNMQSKLQKYYEALTSKNVYGGQYKPDENMMKRFNFKAQDYFGTDIGKIAGIPTTVIPDRSMTNTEFVGLFFNSATLAPNSLEFKIANVKSGAMLESIPDGGKVKIQKVSSKEITVPVITYGGGVSISRDVFFQKKYNEVNEVLSNMMYAKRKAIYDAHIEIIKSLATNDLNYGAGTSVEDKDINTINTMYKTLKNQLIHKVPEFGSTPVYLLANSDMRIRIARAVKSIGASGSINVMESMVRFTFLDENIPTDKFYLVYPGRGFQSVVRMESGSDTVTTDNESRNVNFISWMQIGCAGSDAAQVVSAKTS